MDLLFRKLLKYPETCLKVVAIEIVVNSLNTLFPLNDDFLASTQVYKV